MTVTLSPSLQAVVIQRGANNALPMHVNEFDHAVSLLQQALNQAGAQLAADGCSVRAPPVLWSRWSGASDSLPTLGRLAGVLCARPDTSRLASAGRPPFGEAKSH
jgi:hypothetical protein